MNYIFIFKVRCFCWSSSKPIHSCLICLSFLLTSPLSTSPPNYNMYSKYSTMASVFWQDEIIHLCLAKQLQIIPINMNKMNTSHLTLHIDQGVIIKLITSLFYDRNIWQINKYPFKIITEKVRGEKSSHIQEKPQSFCHHTWMSYKCVLNLL